MNLDGLAAKSIADKETICLFVQPTVGKFSAEKRKEGKNLFWEIDERPQ